MTDYIEVWRVSDYDDLALGRFIDSLTGRRWAATVCRNGTRTITEYAYTRERAIHKARRRVKRLSQRPQPRDEYVPLEPPS